VQAAVAAMSESAKALQAGLEAHFQPNVADESLPAQVPFPPSSLPYPDAAALSSACFYVSVSKGCPPDSAWRPARRLTPPSPLRLLLCPRPPQSIDNVPVFRGEDALRADGTGTFSQDSSRFQQSRLPRTDDEYGFVPVTAYDEQVGVGGATGTGMLLPTRQRLVARLRRQVRRTHASGLRHRR